MQSFSFGFSFIPSAGADKVLVCPVFVLQILKNVKGFTLPAFEEVNSSSRLGMMPQTENLDLKRFAFTV